MGAPLCLLAALGSSGDVFPVVGIGRELARRGWRVTLITVPDFERVARGAGLGFEAVGDPGQLDRVTANPDLWHPVKGFKVLLDAGRPSVRLVYRAIERLAEPGRTIIAASTLVLSARVAGEALGVPYASVHAQPAIVRSVLEPAEPPAGPAARRLPLWARRLAFRAFDAVADRLMGAELNGLRAGLGLPPVRNILTEWIHSPRLSLGMFPEWYGGRPPDWPAQLRCVGFPLFDARDTEPVPDEVRAFLDAGPAPVVFTFGTAMRFCRGIFAASAEACRRAGRRGVLLTRAAEQIPAPLPEGVRHVPYVAFGEAFPRAAAVVHHGGIGTLSQALAAGRPQLVVPFAYDQPDNAARLARLGVARTLSPGRYRAGRVAALLDELTGSAAVRAACGEAAARTRAEDGSKGAADELERMAAAAGVAGA